MEADCFSKFRDPFFEILQLKADQQLKISLKDSPYLILFDMLPNFNLNQIDIDQMKEKFSSKSKYLDILSEYKINLQLNPSLIPLIKEIEILNPSEVEVYSKYTLYSYDSWVLQQDRKTSLESLSTISDSLIKIVNTQYHDLAESALIRIFAYYVFLDEASYQPIFLNLLAKYIETVNNIDSSIYNVFIRIYSNITSQKCTELSSYVQKFLITLKCMLDIHGNLKDLEFFQSIVSFSSDFIQKCEPLTIDLMSSTIKYLLYEQKESVTSQIASSLITLIKNNQMNTNFFTNSNTESYSIDITQFSKNLNQNFVNVETFKGGLLNTPQIHIPETDDMIIYMSKTVLRIIPNVINYLLSNKDQIKPFLSIFIPNCQNNHDIFAVFLYICEELGKNIDKIPEYVDFFINFGLFDQTIICSEKFEGIKHINNFRQASLQATIMSGPDGYLKLLNFCVDKPKLFNEILLRSSSMIQLSSKLFMTSTKLLYDFMSYLILYQNIDYSGNYFVEETRYVLFLFLSLLLSKGNLQDYLFADIKFDEIIFSFLFEESVRPFILGILRTFLNIENANVEQVIGVTLSNVTEHTRMSFPSIKAIKLDNDILMTLNDSISHRISLGEVFKVMCKSMALSITLIDDSDLSRKFLLNVLQLFANCSHVFEFSDDERFTLTNAIQKAYGNDPPSDIFNGLMRIISGNNSNFKTHNFIIRQPKMLEVLYRVHERSCRIYDVLLFVDKLCSYNQLNIVACRDGNIDLLILTTLQNNWYFRTLTEDFVDLCLSLLFKICSLISTVTVVHKFLALLCPFENESLPVYFGKVLECMNKIVVSSLNTPQSTIPLNQDNIIRPVHKLKLEKGFWFVSWFKIQELSHKYNPVLFSMTNEKKKEKILQISLQNNLVNIFLRSKKVTSHSKIEKELKSQEWTFLAIKYQINETGVTFTPYINSQESPQFSFPLPKSKKKNLSLQIGGFDNDDNNLINMENYTLLGGLCVFSDTTDIETVYRFDQHGPEQISRTIGVDFLFKYIPEKTNNFVMNLGAVLANRCKVTSLIPLFSSILVEDQNNNTTRYSRNQNLREIESEQNKSDPFFTNLHNNSEEEMPQKTRQRNNSLLPPLIDLSNDKNTEKSDTLHDEQNSSILSNENSSSNENIPLSENSSLQNNSLHGKNQNMKASENIINLSILEKRKRELNLPKPFLQSNNLRMKEENLSLRKNTSSPNFNISKPTISYLDMVIEFLSNVLLFNDESEKYFFENNGFQMISNILLEYSPEYINFQTYNHFFSLLQLLRTRDLQKTLLSEILTNIQIWIISDRDSFLRILRHWARVLYPSTKGYNEIPFSDILCQYVFYFYDETKSDKHSLCTRFSHRRRSTNLNLSECRRAFLSCLVQRFDEKFTCQDFRTITCFSMILKDKSQSEWLINLIKQITSLETFKQKVPFELDDMKSDILNLLNLETESVTVLVIELFISLYSMGYLKNLNLSENLELLMSKTNMKIINQTSFNLIRADLYDFTSQILSLLFWFSFNLGESFVLKLVTEIEPNSHFCETKDWCFWPIICSLKYRNISPQIFMFLCRCSPHFWSDIYFMTMIICHKTNSDFHEFRIQMLQSITGYFASEYEFLPDEIEKIYFDFIWMSLFHIPNFHLQLPELISTSIFIQNKPSEVVDTELMKYLRGEENNFYNSSEIRNFICSEIGEIDFQFGAFINSENKWIDISLANNILTSYLITKKTQYFNVFVLVLVLTLLLRENVQYGLEHIKSLKFDKEFKSQNQIYIDFLICFMKSHNIKSNIENNKSSNYLYNYFEVQKLYNSYLMEKTKQEMKNLTEFLETKNRKIKVNNIDLDVIDADDILGDYLGELQTKQELNKTYLESQILFMTSETAPFEKSIKYSDYSMRINSLSDNFMMIQTTRAKAKMIRKRKASISLLSFTKPNFNLQRMKEKTEFETETVLHSVKYTFQCDFRLFKDRITITGGDKISHEIRLNTIKYLLPRRINHIPIAIEIFTNEGESVLISFSKVKTDEIINRINILRYISSIGSPLNFSKSWSLHKMSNFDYLMYINMVSGRSYNNTSMYPIFPWVISDFDSEKFEISQKFLRDISKPIAKLKGNFFDRSYLTPHDVIFYLQNIEPFKTIKNEAKVREKFEDIKNVYLESCEIMREVTPEFYCFDMIFDGVKLPKWAKNSVDFVYKMRSALESDFVSSKLNEWIDMIFGIKQLDEDKGIIFNENLYEEIWQLNLSERQKMEIEYEKDSKGQIPSKVFKYEHIPREKAELEKPLKTFTLQTEISEVKSTLMVDNKNTFSVSIMSKEDKRTNYEFSKKNNEFVMLKSNSTNYNTKIENCILLKDNQIISFGSNLSKSDINGYKILELKQITICCSSEKHFLAMTNEFSISIFNKSECRMLKKFPFYGGEPLCCAISDNFHIVAVANNLGEVILQSFAYSMNDIRVVRLGSVTPKLIEITPCFGNVVVFESEVVGPELQQFILVTTINGRFVNKKQIKFEVNSIFCVNCKDEYIIIGGHSGRVQIAKVYDLEFKDVFIAKHPILSVSYSCALNAIVVITTKGEISVISESSFIN